MIISAVEYFRDKEKVTGSIPVSSTKADVAQMVERQTENLCVNGSIPFVGTKLRYIPNTHAKYCIGDNIMILTKISRIEWKTLEDQIGNSNFNLDRVIKLDEMMTLNKTDGSLHAVTELITERHWIDEASAQEYIDFINQKATEYSLNVVSTQIVDAP